MKQILIFSNKNKNGQLVTLKPNFSMTLVLFFSLKLIVMLACISSIHGFAAPMDLFENSDSFVLPMFAKRVRIFSRLDQISPN